MKEVFRSGLLLLALCLTFSAYAGYECTVSSTPSNNTGHCRALSSGNGDMCFTFGEGPACSGDREVEEQ